MRIARWVVSLGFVFCLGPRAQARTGTSVSTQRPRAVILLVVDQFPIRLYDRLLPFLGPGGLRRLAAGGTSFVGQHDHALTLTAVGHTLLATGAYPSASGIVANKWWDRTAWRRVSCTEDAAHTILGRDPGRSPGASPRNLRAAGIADALASATLGRARVLTISWKDRGAIMPGGFHPTATVWFDSEQGAFTTSTYYARTLPAWVANANSARPAAKVLGTDWRTTLAEAQLGKLGGADAAPGEASWEGLGQTFPHPIRSYEALAATPQALHLLEQLAEEGISAEQIGRDAVPDFVSISFSATDYVGHLYGPDSREAVEIVFALDREVARLLTFLDGKIGAARYAVVLTSDHGVASLPERARAEAHGGAPPVRMRPDMEIAAHVEQAVIRAAGPGWQAAFVHPHLYLRPPKGHAERADEALRAARNAVLSMPGVERVLGTSELRDPLPDDTVAQAVRHSWDPERSGDLYVLLSEGSVFDEDLAVGAGTGHGSPRLYDQQVPLVFYGAGVARAGRMAEPVSQRAVAATLAALLGIPAPPDASEPALRQVVLPEMTPRK